MTAQQGPRGQTGPVVSRVLHLLGAFTTARPAMTLTELSRHAKVPLSTAHRMVNHSTLVGHVGAHIIAVFLFIAGMLLLTGASVASVLRATGDSVTASGRAIRETAELVAELVGFSGEIVWDTSMPNGQPRRRLDASRAAELFGFRAAVPLREGIARTVAWYRAQT